MFSLYSFLLYVLTNSCFLSTFGPVRIVRCTTGNAKRVSVRPFADNLILPLSVISPAECLYLFVTDCITAVVRHYAGCCDLRLSRPYPRCLPDDCVREMAVFVLMLRFDGFDFPFLNGFGLPFVGLATEPRSSVLLVSSLPISDVARVSFTI